MAGALAFEGFPPDEIIEYGGLVSNKYRGVNDGGEEVLVFSGKVLVALRPGER